MSVTGTVEKPIIGLTGAETGDSPEIAPALHSTHSIDSRADQASRTKAQLDQGRELLSCPIHHRCLNEVISSLPDFITRFKLTPYRIQEEQGELKGLIAFYAPDPAAPGAADGNDEMYLRFVLRSQECVSRLRKLLPELQTKFPFLKCVTANIQPVPHAVLEGTQEIILTEQSFIRLNLSEDLTLKLAPRAFVQTNIGVARQLYEQASLWISELSSIHHIGEQKIKMMELYSGQGAFSFFAAQSASEVRGVEFNADAVQIANETARELGLSHLKFICADARKVLKEVKAFSPDVLLVNPPRRGLGEGIDTIERVKPQHLIYSSCSVESLASDLKKLSGYQLVKAQLFDMFPHTEHFETLVWLKKI